MCNTRDQSLIRRFEALAKRAGTALDDGVSPDPLAAWLERLKRERVNFRFDPQYGIEEDKDGTKGPHHLYGTIERLCEASADYCAVLESHAFERRQASGMESVPSATLSESAPSAEFPLQSGSHAGGDVGSNARKPKPSKPIPGWTADDEKLAKLKLEKWQTGRIPLGKDWGIDFEARVEKEYGRQNFPGSGYSPPADLKPGENRAQILARICTERLQERIAHLPEKVRKFFEICCDIQQKRGQPKTSDFVKGINEEDILPIIQAEKREILAEFQQYCPVGVQDSLLENQRHLDEAVSRIENEWNRIIQGEVREAEIAALEARRQPQLSPPSEKNTTPGSQVPIPKLNGAEPAQPEQPAGMPDMERGAREHKDGQECRLQGIAEGAMDLFELAQQAVTRLKDELARLPRKIDNLFANPEDQKKLVAEDITRSAFLRRACIGRHEQEFLESLPSGLPQLERELARTFFREKSDETVKEFCRRHGLELGVQEKRLATAHDSPKNEPGIRKQAGRERGPNVEMAQAGPKLSNRKAPIDLTPIPSLDALKKRNSLHDSQAAVVFDVTTRTIRGWVNEGKLNRSARGRIVTTDQAFEDLYRATHGPAHQ